MRLSETSLDKLTPDDLDALVKNQVIETRTLEYKLSLPGNSDADTREFLADVSAFANSAGGLMLFGIKTDKGVPQEVVGLPDINADTEILRLESKLQDGLTPRVPGVITRAIDLPNGRIVLVMSIPNSWTGPHMISFKRSSRFYGRNSAGKYQLDYPEIQSAFLANGAIGQRLREFRLDRVGKVIARVTPVPLSEGSATLLHVVPRRALSAAPTSLDARAVQSTIHKSGINLQSGGPTGLWPNFDGVVAPGKFGYAQIYRNGIMEFADCGQFEPVEEGPMPERLRLQGFETDTVRVTVGALQLLQACGVEGPCFILASMLDVAGRRDQRSHRAVDRDHLLATEVEFAAANITTASVSRALQPLFDQFWNAVGKDYSPFYSNDGKWHKLS